PLAALRAYAECMAQMGQSPRELAHHLAYLQLDLTDPELRKHVGAQARATREAIRELLELAITAGELPAAVDTAAMARAVAVTLSGSLFTWAFYQEGSAMKWVCHDLDTLLARFGAAAVHSKRQRSSRRSGRGRDGADRRS